MRLADVLSLAADDLLAGWGVAAEMDPAELSALDQARLRAWSRAAAAVNTLVDPTARVSPHAVLGQDIIVGPGCVIHEFATVRDRSILGAGVQIGHGCEVARCVLGSGSRLAHQVVLCDTTVGRTVHLSAAVILGSVHLWNDDMAHPDRPIAIRLDARTRYPCGRPKFGGVLGDAVRIGMGALLGPGLIVGAGSVIYPHVVAAEQVIPADSVVRPNAPALRIEPRRYRHPAAGEGEPAPTGPHLTLISQAR
jgi:NDP-sugar pyrophosphorylase family protein